MDFAHLHVHTQYSLLDGACRIEELVPAAKELGMRHLAITDHGVMYGVVDFYKAAKAAGIRPVIGCEVYVAPGSRLEKTAAQREYAHLVLLCENEEGYRNLTVLSSLGFTEGFYYRPRVDVELLRRHSKGLIALSACLSGDIPRLLLDGRYQDALATANQYLEIFGENNYFLEMQNHGMQEQRLVNEGLVRLSRESGIPLVATNDVHYMRREDAQAQEVLMCIQTGKTLEDEGRMRLSTQELFLKSPEEMARLFPFAPDAIPRTAEIAERCHMEFELGKYHLPSFATPQDRDPEAYLREQCEAGLHRLYGEDPAPAARERLDYELSMIVRMGYVDYFLIVWDFIRYAKEHGIMVGPGRGSSAGSIVAYTLGITGVDPLRYGLVFERFLNPERISMPDIDIDFCYERRQEVIDYVVGLYGEERVAQIITFGTMKAKAAVRDVARVLGLPYATGDKIAKLIPFALDMTLRRAVKISAELRTLADDDESVAEVLRIAQAVEGMPRHASTHAAGVVIAARPLTDFVPLQKNDDVVTTQFPMGTIEELGLLKMDFLGLRTLTILRDSVDMIRARGIEFRLEDIPLNDAATLDMLCEGDTDGVFQMESGGMRRVLTELRPSRFEDIMSVIALYRPGPMESIPRYIQGKHHPETVHYEHPIMEDALSETYGCMVYQEQVMQLVRDMAGYSMGRSDLVRRAMSKKKRDVMERERAVFVSGLVKEDGAIDVPGAVRRGIPEDVAIRVFDLMEGFASYAFPKAHAAAYALLVCQTAYLKRHYPVEFMAACMNSAMGDSAKVSGFIQYCRKAGVTVLPPDVNASQIRFAVEGGAIRFGLYGVKSVSENGVKAILRARHEAPFRDIYDFCERVNGESLNKRAMECLVKAGALDGLPGNRAQKLNLYEGLMDAAYSIKKRNTEGQVSLFGGEDISAMLPRPPLPEGAELPRRFLLQMEKEMTGVYISGHPLEEYRRELDALPMTTMALAALGEEDNPTRHDGEPARMGGMVADRRMLTTKAGNQMCFLQLEDLYGVVEVLVFPRVYEKYSHLLQPDAALLISGKLSLREDEEPKFVADTIEPLRGTTLYLRVADMAAAQAILPMLQPGRTHVVLRLEAEGKTLRAPQSWLVNDHILAGLKRELGERNVAMK